MKLEFFVLLACLVIGAQSRADIVTLVGGGKLECTVLQENRSGTVVLYGTGLLDLDRSTIQSIERSPKPPTTKGAPEVHPRVPTWAQVVTTVAAERWAKDLSQIPATVIDVGVLKNVPYKSHRCAETFEINVYGDPDSPVGFEVGIVKSSEMTLENKKACIAFVAKQLGDSTDKKILALLDLEQDIVIRRGLTIEVTPPSAADAYGGWWVSVYDEARFDQERATDAELAQITQPKTSPRAEQIEEQPVPQPGRPNNAQADEADEALNRWTTSDLSRARPSREIEKQSSVPAPSSQAIPSDGSVYVRGYYRKDGTYVRPHTRRK